MAAHATAARGMLNHVARGAGLVAGIALAALAAVCAWQVFARYVLNDAPGWTEPVALLLLNTVMMFGAAVAVRSEAHFGFFIALEAAPPRLRLLMRAGNRGLVVAIGAALAWWGMRLGIDGWPVTMAGTPLPQGLAFAPLTLGGALIALFALERLVAGGPAPEAR
jgi:TRAP-type C4-dicarboxylate transport system permease small subunit